MAEPAPEKPASSGGTFGFLTKKLGPVPVWLWALLAFGIYYWYTHFGPGASPAKAAPGGGSGLRVIEVKGPAGSRGPAGPSGPPGVQPRKPVRPVGKGRPPTRNPHSPVGGAGGGPAAAPQAAPSPAYDQFTAGADGDVPDPMQVYAPMTAGAVYG